MRTRNHEELNPELDNLLLALRDTQIVAPSSRIRENLRRIAATLAGDVPGHSRRRGYPRWLSWAFLNAVCAALVFGFALHSIHRFHNRAGSSGAGGMIHVTQKETAHPVARHQRGPGAARKAVVSRPERLRPPAPGRVSSRPDSFSLDLPWSNREIANGTSSTIRVAVSREELVALGLPLADARDDGRYIAEISLGDDGLPRSIRVPLPLRRIR